MRKTKRIMGAWTKGSPPPKGYAAWHEWAEAQSAHGLKQEKCQCCGKWLFPQERHGEWNPFPPPGPGIYDVRDSTGVLLEAVPVTLHRNGKLKCLGMDARRTMVAPHCSLGYEWRVHTTSSKSF